MYYSYNRVGLFPGWPVRTADGMYNWASDHTSPAKLYFKRVAFSDLKVGDLVFYNPYPNNSRYIDHVAFYAGNGRVFDAQQPGTNVGYHGIDAVSGRVAAYRVMGLVTL